MINIRFAMWPSVAILAVLGGSTSARADFNSAIAGLVLSSTNRDTDLDLLIRFVGLSPGPPLQSITTITTTGFTTALSGTFEGRSLNVAYTGNLSAFPGGAYTWTSNGIFGADTWTGSGSATFSFPTATTFQMVFSSTLSVGSNTGLDSLLISGTTPSVITYTGTSGTIIANGLTTPAPPHFNGLNLPEHPSLGIPDEDYIETPRGMIFAVTAFPRVDPSPPDPPQTIVDVGIINVPEPTSVALVGIGGLLLFGYCQRRNGRRMPSSIVRG